jgi:hypothetical protein
MEVQLYAFVNSAQGSGGSCTDTMTGRTGSIRCLEKSVRLSGIELRLISLCSLHMLSGPFWCMSAALFGKD